MLNAIKTSQNRQILKLLLEPSWLSALVAVVIGLAVSVGVIVVFQFDNSTARQQIITWQQSQATTSPATPDDIFEESSPTPQNIWPLLVFWCVVGLVVYAIAAAIVSSALKAERFREELSYVHANPKDMLEKATVYWLLRLLSAAALIISIVLFFKLVVPYCLTASHASASDIWSPDGVLYALLSFVIAAVSAQAITVLLRLSAGKPRLLS